jgi:saccharopine dehydrogenase-like NADP-dependent oxidoreductase
MKRVLILGAGRVARPCVAYLQKHDWIELTVADTSGANLERACGVHGRTRTLVRDCARDLADLLRSERPDLVINLLPPELMAPAARLCLEARVHLVHPAYLDPGTAALARDVQRSGLVFLAELGLDPGIDHMSAARTIAKIHSREETVQSFRSVCGALPSAAANTNPWGYKLSWSPESLVGASQRDAKARLEGEVKEWLHGRTYEHVFLEHIDGLGWFEIYANGDSLPYLDIYRIPEAETLFRGTVRYCGWCETIVAMNKLGLFERDRLDFAGMTLREFMARKCGWGRPENAEWAVCAVLGTMPWSAISQRLAWLGLFDDRPIPFAQGTSRDVIHFLFDEKLVFAPGEKDLVVLKDEIVAVDPATGAASRHRSILIDFGLDDGTSSVARTTGLPPAIAARYILEGAIRTAGVVLPTLPEIYDRVLPELQREGIRLQERVDPLPG